MKKHLPRVWQITLGIAILAMFIYVLPITHLIKPVEAATTIISGTVTDTDSNPMANVEMWLYSGGAANNRSTKYTDANGDFSYDTDDFTFSVGDFAILEARTPTGYNAENSTQVDWIWDGSTYVDSPVNPQFVLAPKTITGNVTFDPSGDPASNVDIVAYPLESIIVGNMGIRQVSANTDVNGDYTMYLRSGVTSWSVQAVVNLSDHNTAWLPTGSPVNVAFTNNSSSETQTLDFTVESTTASISATFLDADGNLLTSGNFQADCSIFRSDGIGTIRKVDSESKLVNIGLPAGIYTYWCFHDDLAGQSFLSSSFVLDPDETKDLGTIQAQTDGSTITGTVTSVSTGEAIANTQITASNRNNPNFLTDDTDSNGLYSFTVGAGTWTIGVDQENANYRIVESKTVYITSNSTTSSGNDIQFEALDIQVNGSIQDENGSILTGFSGLVYIETSDGEFFGTPVETGAYTFFLPQDLNNQSVTIGASGDVGSTYSLLEAETLTISGSTTKNIVLVPDNAVLFGTLLNESGVAIAPSENEIIVVAVDDNGNIEQDTVGTDGTYSMNIPPGNWHVTYRVEDESSTILSPPVLANTVVVGANQAITHNIDVKIKGATITGTITDADGVGVPLAPVIATNIPILKATEDFEPGDITQVFTSANASGVYSFSVPNGEYKVFTGTTPDIPASQIKPEIASVTVAEGATATANLAFTASDATITGTVKDSDGNAIASGNVAAYTANGGFVEAEIGSDGLYSLSVDSGDEWQLVATNLSGTDLLMAQNVSVTTVVDSNSQDLTVTDSGIDVPGAVTKSFDTEEFANIALPNGTNIQFSTFAIDDSGIVSISTEPRIDLSPSLTGDPVSVAYDIKARNSDGVEVSKLNSPVKITMPYNETFLNNNGIQEDNIMPQFYAEGEEYWSHEGTTTLINQTENKVVVYSDHLSKFSINGVATSEGISSDQDPPTTTASPAAGTYTSVQSVTLTCDDGSGTGCASTYYTIDGTDPTTSSTAYSSAISISATTTLKYFSTDVAGNSESALTSVYTLNIPQQADILATPASGGGPQIVLIDGQGNVQSSFFAYSSNLRIGLSAVSADVDNDGENEIIVAPGAGAGPQVRIFNRQGDVEKQFYAYASTLRSGIRVYAGDVNNDGVAEIITSTMSGAGPQLRIFNSEGTVINQFDVYASTYRNGFRVMIGDVNGDGTQNIIVLPDTNAGPQIRVFDYQGNVISSFWAYSQTIRGGYNAAVGDVDSDGTADILVTTKAGLGPQVAIFKGDGTLIRRFFAYAESFRGGFNVSVGDVNNDGVNDIIACPESLAGPQIRIFNNEGTALSQFWMYAQSLRGQFTSFVADVNSDGVNEIVTAPGEGMGPQVRVFDYQGNASAQFFTHHTGFRGGLNIFQANR